jgi:hypothetical protein
MRIRHTRKSKLYRRHTRKLKSHRLHTYRHTGGVNWRRGLEWIKNKIRRTNTPDLAQVIPDDEPLSQEGIFVNFTDDTSVNNENSSLNKSPNFDIMTENHNGIKQPIQPNNERIINLKIDANANMNKLRTDSFIDEYNTYLIELDNKLYMGLENLDFKLKELEDFKNIMQLKRNTMQLKNERIQLEDEIIQLEDEIIEIKKEIKKIEEAINGIYDENDTHGGRFLRKTRKFNHRRK